MLDTFWGDMLCHPQIVSCVRQKLIIYHEDGQSFTELTETKAITTDGEGRVTQMCKCLSYYGELYAALCAECNEWDGFVAGNNCHPNCKCRLLNHWENLKDEDKILPRAQYPFWRYLCPLCLQYWEKSEKLDDFRKYCTPCLSFIWGTEQYWERIAEETKDV